MDKIQAANAVSEKRLSNDCAIRVRCALNCMANLADTQVKLRENLEFLATNLQKLGVNNCDVVRVGETLVTIYYDRDHAGLIEGVRLSPLSVQDLGEP